jgi:hypothetical protein
MVKGVIAQKGRVLGQSFDGFLLMPITTFESMYGRRKTTVVSVKMHDAAAIDGAMLRAEEAMRVAHRLSPWRRTTSPSTRPMHWWRSGRPSPGAVPDDPRRGASGSWWAGS